MPLRPIIILVLAIVLSVVFQNPAPLILVAVFAMFLAVIRYSIYDHRPYRDRYLTDSISEDGSVTNLRGVSLEDLEASNYRRHLAEVNNRLALENNDGKGPHEPDA